VVHLFKLKQALAHRVIPTLGSRWEVMKAYKPICHRLKSVPLLPSGEAPPYERGIWHPMFPLSCARVSAHTGRETSVHK